MSEKRYLIISYTAKDGPKEFSCTKGYILNAHEAIGSFGKIRKDCLDWANNKGESFEYFTINSMTFVNERDYNSFFEIYDN